MGKKKLTIKDAIYRYLNSNQLDKYRCMKELGFDFRQFDSLDLHSLNLEFMNYIKGNNLQDEFINTLPETNIKK
jgi:hypothetical protein